MCLPGFLTLPLLIIFLLTNNLLEGTQRVLNSVSYYNFTASIDIFITPSNLLCLLFTILQGRILSSFIYCSLTHWFMQVMLWILTLFNDNHKMLLFVFMIKFSTSRSHFKLPPVLYHQVTLILWGLSCFLKQNILGLFLTFCDSEISISFKISGFFQWRLLFSNWSLSVKYAHCRWCDIASSLL